MSGRDEPPGLIPAPHPIRIERARISPALRVLVLAPHPDDFDAVGVTLRRLRDNGNRIHLAVLTSGANGVDDGFAGAVTRADKGALREREQRASCRFFGLPEERLAFLALGDDDGGHLAAGAANLERVGDCLAAERPDLVVLPHGNDPNVAHRTTCALLRRAAREGGLVLVAVWTRDPKTVRMRADLIAAFGAADAAWKAELLRFHQSQHQRNLRLRGAGLDARILGCNRDSAGALGLAEEFAEVFELEAFGGAEPEQLLGVSA